MNHRRLAFATVALVLGLGLTQRLLAEDEPYEGSRFGEVWDVVAAEPYDTLPKERVALSRFFDWGRNRLLESARRTVSDQSDVIPRFDKLLHPNGICLAGTWNITEPSEYTGYFEEGKSGLIVARASVALTETTRGHYRGFGLAGKIWPTLEENPVEPMKTANFFVIDDLAGTRRDHFLDAPLTNQPDISVRPSGIFLAPIVPPVLSALSRADKNPTIRQVYPIAELGLAEGEASRTPHWMKIEGAPGDRIDAHDFRDELHVDQYEHGIYFDIFVAEKGFALTPHGADWQRIGFIEFTRSVAADGCDHRLHFAHPTWRD